MAERQPLGGSPPINQRPRAVRSTRPRARLLLGCSFAVCAFALGGCTPPEATPDEVAVIQLAAATGFVEDIARNPGPIATVCVGYAGDWEDPGLPVSRTGALRLSYMDGCVDVEGRLVATADGAQAISVSVGPPALTADDHAEVAVVTSTGSIDVAAYTCSVRGRAGSWLAEGCELEAIS